MSRRYRWTLEATLPTGKLEETIIRLASRPDYPLSPPFEITTTFFDIDAKDDKFKDFYAYFSKIIEFEGDKSCLPDDLVCDLKLRLMFPTYIYEPPVKPLSENELEKKETNVKRPMGMGLLGNRSYKPGPWELIETWEMKKSWPKQVSFGELDHSSSELVSLDVTWVCNEASYTSNTPSFN